MRTHGQICVRMQILHICKICIRMQIWSCVHGLSRLISWVIHGKDDLPRVSLDGMHSRVSLSKVVVLPWRFSSLIFEVFVLLNVIKDRKLKYSKIVFL